ncbi:hypothetical protein [Streptomyces candidus]|nr:hypothetical protein [Streptomyces candidus]
MTLLLAIPAFDRTERRFPYGLPLALAGLGLLTRYELTGLPDRTHAGVRRIRQTRASLAAPKDTSKQSHRMLTLW